MNPGAVAAIMFVCVFGGALIGNRLRLALPDHHLSPESRDVVKLGTGVIATMSALILGLVTAAAQGSFEREEDAVRSSGADVLVLDRVLAHYGPDTQEIRQLLRRAVARRLELTWPEHASGVVELDAPDMTPNVEGIETRIRALSPQSDAQRRLQSDALALCAELVKTRWLALEGAASSIPAAFLVMLLFWLTVTFGSFGMLAPRNPTVLGVLLVCALSVAGALFLIIEMDQPFHGLMKVSGEPLRYALERMGR